MTAIPATTKTPATATWFWKKLAHGRGEGQTLQREANRAYGETFLVSDGESMPVGFTTTLLTVMTLPSHAVDAYTLV